MKVVQINAVYGATSTGVITKDLHLLSQQEGIDSYVVYSYANQIPPNGYKIGSLLERKWHALLARVSGRMGGFSRLSTVKLLQYLDKLKPDIIHLHNLHGCYIHVNMLLKYAAKKNISVVLTLHDCWFYTGGCYHYTFVQCQKWKAECGDCPQRYVGTPAYLRDASKSILLDRKKYFGAIKDLYVVGVSQWITDEAKYNVFKGKNCLKIYNGIDLNIFKPTKSDFKKEYGIEDKFVILGPATKWLNPMNEGILKYVSEKISDDMVFVIFGVAPHKEPTLPNVKYVPYIKDRQQLAALYSAADVFINCTREESLSLINVEAQACGTPVITYRNTGVQETVDGVSSFSVENGDIESMVNYILQIYNSGKSIYSAGCMKWVAENFEVNNNYKEYIRLYKKIKNCNNKG